MGVLLIPMFSNTLLLDCWQKHTFSIIFFGRLLSLGQFSLNFDHFFLQEINKSRMFFLFFLLFRVQWFLFFLLFSLFLLLQLPYLLGQDVVVIFVLKFETVELFNKIVDKRFDSCHFFINFVINYYLVNLFLVKLNHEYSIFIGSFVKQSYGMQIDGLIKYDILNLSFSFAKHIPQLIKVKEVKLELNAVILHELKIVSPVRILFVCNFEHRTECFGTHSVSYHYTTFSHEDFCILLIANKGHRIDSHKGIWYCIIYKQIFDIFGSFTSLYLLLPFLFDSLEKNLAAYLLSILLAFFKCLNGQDDFAHLLFINIKERRLNIISVKISEVGEIDLCSKYFVQIRVIQILMLTKYFDLYQMSSIIIDV